MYTPYFSAHIVRFSEHIWPILRTVPLNLDCVPYSKTPNFDIDHTPYLCMSPAISHYHMYGMGLEVQMHALHVTVLCMSPAVSQDWISYIWR